VSYRGLGLRDFTFMAAPGLRSIRRMVGGVELRVHYRSGEKKYAQGALDIGAESLALFEKATMKDGAIEQTNFDTYTPMRMSQIPEVAVNIIANGEKATGVGEPAVTVVAPAIANAVYNACGARVRALPITADAVKAGMKKA